MIPGAGFAIVGSCLRSACDYWYDRYDQRGGDYNKAGHFCQPVRFRGSVQDFRRPCSRWIDISSGQGLDMRPKGVQAERS